MKDDKLFIIHMLEAIVDIETMTKDGKASFDQSIAIKHGVCRCFEIIGEASVRCSPLFKEIHNHVDWKSIIGLRNIIIHQYDKINYDLIWDLTQNELKQFHTQLKIVMNV